VLRHFSIKRAINQVPNFFLGELATIPLLLDQKIERGLDEPARRNISFIRHELVAERRAGPARGKVCEPIPFPTKVELKQPQRPRWNLQFFPGKNKAALTLIGDSEADN
jgi:hypothetical protein